MPVRTLGGASKKLYVVPDGREVAAFALLDQPSIRS